MTSWIPLLAAYAFCCVVPPQESARQFGPFTVTDAEDHWIVNVHGKTLQPEAAANSDVHDRTPMLVDNVLVLAVQGGMEGISESGKVQWRIAVDGDKTGWRDPVSVVRGRHVVAFVTGDFMHPARDFRWQLRYMWRGSLVHAVSATGQRPSWEGSVGKYGRPLIAIRDSIACCKRSRTGKPLVVLRDEWNGRARLVLRAKNDDWRGLDYVMEGYTYERAKLDRVHREWRLTIVARPHVTNPPKPYETITLTSRRGQ